MDRIDADWLNRPETQEVCAMLMDAGAQALCVGGCVRNAILGAPISDVDIATDARPDRVIALAEQAGLRAVPTGVEHGTVTVLSGGTPYEVTTFRRDVETDGRRAVVAFSDDLVEDAARRDFTMNALYARPDGRIVDPLGGMPDLRARRVRFIGRASDRIREDYLRSLRYFRFHAWYGDAAAGFDPDALAAIADNLEGLSGLSRERIGAEMLKILSAADPAPSVAVMAQVGVLARVFPGANDRALAPLVHLEAETGLVPDGLRRLAALGGDAPGEDLRLSKAQRDRAALLRELAVSGDAASALGYRHGMAAARDALLLRAALMERPVRNADLEAARRGAGQEFPVSPKDLMPGYSGPALGKRLARLTDRWIASDFTLDREALLALPDGPENGGNRV